MMEEIVFRGVFMQALDSAFGADGMSVTIQAWLFGAMHYREGFPNGGWGLAMACVYGIMLGTIRRRSKGMLAPWLVHAWADLVIFVILAGIALRR
jgi:membrane protease YdiL (CAAX protease family)